MRLAKSAWWVLVPLSWLWQYLVYVPAYLAAEALSQLWSGVFGSRVLHKPQFRPWLRERLR